MTFTPTIQYLPFRLAGVVQCYIKANPPLQYVTWTKDKRLLEPYQTKDIVIMNNGSLLFTRVNQNHQVNSVDDSVDDNNLIKIKFKLRVVIHARHTMLKAHKAHQVRWKCLFESRHRLSLNPIRFTNAKSANRSR